MILTLEQLSKIIREQDFKWCYVYDLSGCRIAYWADKGKGEEGQKMTCNELVNKLTGFIAEHPGKYITEFKRNSTDNANTVFRYTIQDAVLNTPILQGVRHEKPEEVEKRIRESIMNDLEQKRQKEEIEELKDEYKEKCKELDMVSGKVSYMLAQFFQNLMTGQKAMGVLQGTSNASEGQEYTEGEKKRINEALFKALSVMDVDTFEAFANKVVEKPEIVDQLKMFI
jgi:hypothetical protein